MGCIFLGIWFLTRNEKKNEKKISPQNCIFLNQFCCNFNIWLEKISGQGFSSIFVKFLPFFKVECYKDIVEIWKIIKNYQNLAKNRQKMKKINFLFLIPHFSPINEKLKKNDKQEILVFVQPIPITEGGM